MKINTKCSVKNCSGFIDLKKVVNIKGVGPTSPCKICGVLHVRVGYSMPTKSANGSPFLRDGKVFIRDEKGVERDFNMSVISIS